jgi:excisionase family DNA binding protein
MPTVDSGPVYRAEGACRRLGISKSALYRLRIEGRIESYTIGAARFFSETAIVRFLDTVKGASHE